MKIRTQFIVMMLLYGFILTLIAIFLYITNQQVVHLDRQEEVVRNIERKARELSYLSNDYLLHSESQQRVRWQATFTALSNDLDQLTLNQPEQRVLAEQMRDNLERLQTVFTDVAVMIESRQAVGERGVDMSFIQLSWSRLEIQSQGIIFDAALLAQMLRDQQDQLKQMNILLIFFLAAIFGSYILSNYYLVYRRTLHSLARLQAGTKIIGSGQLDYVIQDHHKDEIGALSQAFNHMTTNLREITASKADLERALSERRQMEARLRRLVEANLIGVMTRDGQGQIKDANEAFLLMLGYSSDDLLGDRLNIIDLVPPEDRELELQRLSEPQTPGESRPLEKTFLNKNGQMVPVLVGETQVDGDSKDFIGFVLDLSELKQAQAALADYAEKLKRSNQELEQFAFIASHDLQEPLRKIRGFSDTLVRRLSQDITDDQREYLMRMQNAAERMQAMIDDLLELSRVGRRGRKFETVQLTEVVAEVISDLDHRIQTAHGQVSAEPLPEIECDPLQMRQLLQNLIGNAIKYHKPDEAPLVRVWSSVAATRLDGSGAVTIHVQDNGIGFSEEYLDRIFQPFTRLHGRGVYEGTGMGLAICKKIVEHHHGEITAHSMPGQGATFCVTLPLRQPQETAASLAADQ